MRGTLIAEFRAVEAASSPHLAEGRSAGLSPEVSPIFKTPDEARQGSLLFLDMVEDTRVLYDRGGFLRETLAKFKARLDRLDALRAIQDARLVVSVAESVIPLP